MSKVNIYKIKKPNIEPPVTLSVQNIEDVTGIFNSLYEKYRTDMHSLIEMKGKGYDVAFITVFRSIVDMILLEYESISLYMNNIFYKKSGGNKNQHEETIKRGAYTATSSAWLIGKEFINRDPYIATQFSNSDTIEIQEIPYGEFQLLLKAVYVIYYPFAVIFTDYYNSKYGHRMRFQKEGHFRDTYQSMMKGMLACFLEGIQS
jgi:hypothetical protein